MSAAMRALHASPGEGLVTLWVGPCDTCPDCAGPDDEQLAFEATWVDAVGAAIQIMNAAVRAARAIDVDPATIHGVIMERQRMEFRP